MRPSTIEGLKRTDTRVVPTDMAFREVVVNACVHRNYSIAGSQIRIFMFNDRIQELGEELRVTLPLSG